MQAYLDSLSQLSGSILYRDPIGWKALPPGPLNWVLGIGADSLPTWVPKQGYNPALMQYTAPGGYYSGPVSIFTNQFTLFMLLRCAPRAGTGSRYACVHHNGTGNSRRLAAAIGDTSHGISGRISYFGKNAAGTNIFAVNSTNPVDDGVNHIQYLTVDCTTGDALLVEDGVPKPFTATIDTLNQGNLQLDVGRTTLFGGAEYNGVMGMFALSDQYLPNWEDFPTDPNLITHIDETDWSQFQVPPLVFNPYGQLTDNRGQAANLTQNGTITPVTQ